MFLGDYVEPTTIHWIARVHSYDLLSVSLIFASLLLLTISRVIQRNLILNIGNNLFRNYAFKTHVSSVAYLLLVLNYFVAIIGLLRLTSKFDFTPYLGFNIDAELLYPIAMIALLIPFFNHLISRIILGNSEMLEEAFNVSYSLIVFKTVLFTLLQILWVFNQQWSNQFIIIFLGIIVIFQIFRFGLLFQKSFKFNLPWFYLFLYLCTLEILPYLSLALFIKEVK